MLKASAKMRTLGNGTERGCGVRFGSARFSGLKASRTDVAADDSFSVRRRSAPGYSESPKGPRVIDRNAGTHSVPPARSTPAISSESSDGTAVGAELP